MTLTYSNISGTREKGKSFLTFTLAVRGNTCPMAGHLFCYRTPWTMRVEYHQAGGSCQLHLFNQSIYKACQNYTHHRSKRKICIHWANSKMSLCWKALGRVCHTANMVRWNHMKHHGCIFWAKSHSEKKKKECFDSKGGLEIQLICIFIQLNCLTKSHIGLASCNVFSSLCLSRLFF